VLVGEGFMQWATMSLTSSTNRGSVDSLNRSIGHDLSCVRPRVDQCVALCGFPVRVSTITTSDLLVEDGVRRPGAALIGPALQRSLRIRTLPECKTIGDDFGAGPARGSDDPDVVNGRTLGR
jgi:hypothetical protein